MVASGEQERDRDQRMMQAGALSGGHIGSALESVLTTSDLKQVAVADHHRLFGPVK